jgi:hypothetical protein
MGYVLFVKVYGQPKEVLRLLVSLLVLIERYNVALEILRVLQISAMEVFFVLIEILGNAKSSTNGGFWSAASSPSRSGRTEPSLGSL